MLLHDLSVSSIITFTGPTSDISKDVDLRVQHLV